MGSCTFLFVGASKEFPLEFYIKTGRSNEFEPNSDYKELRIQQELRFTMDTGISDEGVFVKKRRGGLGGRSSLKLSLTTVESLKVANMTAKLEIIN